MKITDIVTEAANPAQQAAKAIAMKKAGKKPKTEGILGSDPNRGQKIPNWAKRGIVGKMGRKLDPAWSDVQMTVPQQLLSKQSSEPATNTPATKDMPKTASVIPTKAIPQSAGTKPSQPVTKNIVKTIADKQGVAEDTELAEEFDLIESIVEMIAEHNGVDADVVWADLESLTEDELYVFAVTSDPLMEDWQKANKRDRTDGMSQKAVNAYRRENPGSKLKTAVTTKPGKLKKGGKASKRRKSYCSRSRGQMKMHSISCAKTPDKAICKARRRWNC